VPSWDSCLRAASTADLSNSDELVHGTSLRDRSVGSSSRVGAISVATTSSYSDGKLRSRGVVRRQDSVDAHNQSALFSRSDRGIALGHIWSGVLTHR